MPQREKREKEDPYDSRRGRSRSRSSGSGVGERVFVVKERRPSRHCTVTMDLIGEWRLLIVQQRTGGQKFQQRKASRTLAFDSPRECEFVTG